jgi:hypothetical protein
MKFLNWFRAKPNNKQFVLTAEIVVSPSNPPEQLPPFCVSDGVEVVNLLPIAQQVLSDYPERVPFTAEHLADLTARKSYYGQYIKVADYPPGIPRELAQQMMTRTMKWWRFMGEFRRKALVSDVFTSSQLSVGEICCARALKISSSPVPNEEVERVPLNGCWEPNCQCSWRLISRFERKRQRWRNSTD